MPILLLLLLPVSAFAWGEVGHELVVEFGNKLVKKDVFANCNISNEELILHTNDPDRVWKSQRGKYRHEPMAHYFHVDAQQIDWQSKASPERIRTGFLVYRISEWSDLAKEFRKKKKWPELKEKLYGISHYLGDLTQPLHLHSDHDGKKAGLPGLHSQFETKMINRYRKEIRDLVSLQMAKEAPKNWKSASLRQLTYDTAVDSYSKANLLFSLSKEALQFPKSNKKNSKTKRRPRFIKKILWKQTSSFAAERISLGAKLWAHFFNQICSDSL